MRALGPRYTLLALALGAAGACGYSDPGKGTQTLAVTGALDASFATLATALDFVVLKEAQPITDATITLQDADSRDTVVVPFDASSQRYLGLWPGLHRRVLVQVAHGADSLEAQVEGPARHTVAHPHQGAVLRRQDPLDVRWATEDGVRADSVAVVVRDGDREVMRHVLRHDSGQDHIVATALGAGSVDLTVARETALVPRGGAEGSTLVCRYSVSTHVVRQ